MRKSSIKSSNTVNLVRTKRKKSCGRFFKEFASNTSLHGLKYVGERERSTIERVWWALMILLCICLCGYLIIKVVIKWNSNPVIVSFAESPTPIWKLPFPAITICPITKIIRSKFNFTEFMLNIFNSEEDESLYNIVNQFCMNKLVRFFPNGIQHMYVNESYIETFLNATVYDEENFFWSNSVEGELVPMITQEGICYTFNMLSPDEIYKEEVIKNKPHLIHSARSNGWTLDQNYLNDSPWTYPMRILEDRQVRSFHLILGTFKSNVDHHCSMSYKGYKISLHAPNILPKMSQHCTWLGPQSAIEIVVKPTMITTSDSLKGYSPEKRNCYFTHERNLAYFKEYTRENCEFECLTNMTLTRCGCVHLAMPRINVSTPICGTFLVKYCVMLPLLGNIYENCTCLPSCTSIGYETSSSIVTLDWENFVETTSKVNNVIEKELDKELSVLRITFEDEYFMSSKRSELYGIIDFLANCGGLLGVCLGFSILSLVEIFYFFIVRIIIDIRRNKKIVAPKENTS